jgi:hypothetical protein
VLASRAAFSREDEMNGFNPGYIGAAGCKVRVEPRWQLLRDIGAHLVGAEKVSDRQVEELKASYLAVRHGPAPQLQ